ncbi:MAG: ribonucleoside-diphosphate reductase subunit alpha [Methylococcales bacterium]|nr:ribonucleoside-diphosphate reductase subunit alpha [Methylococcales bacterium]MDD5753271.1 ribonucleoside-diphosphate reductase subunit alpha [Methylococcales bacterium]
MLVVKRNGEPQKIAIAKIHKAVEWACNGLDVSLSEIETNAHIQFFDGIKTSQIHIALVNSAASLIDVGKTDYEFAAARLLLQQIYKEVTQDTIYPTLSIYISNAISLGKIKPEMQSFDLEELNSAIDVERDNLFKYLGMQTVYDRYLLRDENQKLIEMPQHFWMRVAMGIALNETPESRTKWAIEFYNVLSKFEFISSTPTLFNAGTKFSQMSSCFVTTTDDSIWEEQEGVNFGKGIFATMTECALYSKFAGGIGTDWTRVRPAGAGIGSTHGMSSGVVPYLKVFNDTAVSVNQCFDGDTRIFTKSGFKTIKNIVVGDMVLGVRGDFNAVYELRDYDQKEAMLKIDVKHSIDKLKVTDAHPIYAIQGANLETSVNDTLNALEKGKLNANWIEAKNLKVGDYVAQPIPKMVCPIENFTDDDARMYGIMLGDEKDITADSFINLPFNREHLYNEDGKKRIHETMMFLPESQTIALIKGLIETDGNISRGKEVTFCSTSLQLVEGLRLLLLRLECPSAANVKEVTDRTIRGVEIADTTAYSVRIPMIEKLAKALNVPALTKFNWLVHNGCVFSRIKEITPVEPSAVVYDLKVDADHSYTTSACVVHNGGKRNGSFAAYLEPWHGDIERFINLKKPNGDERLRAREIFPYIWANDLFMQRVKAREKWSLFCSHKNAELCETHGEEFERNYLAAEERGDAIKVIDAMELWKGIITALVESGAPLITFKDEHNRRNPQNHVGVIRSSNLCSEISLNTSDDESAVCNLGSINVSVCTQADFPRVIPIAMRMLDNVIDLNFYPTEKARRSNLKHRPVGLGLMGWTDYIISQGIDWESDEHLRLTDFVFEDFSYWAIKSSMEIAKEKGRYTSYEGSKWSHGILPIDTARKLPDEWRHGSRDVESWDTLRTEIQQHGMRNSNCMAIAPTATIANIVGTTPCIEPIYKQVFVKENKSGKFKVVDPAMRHNRPELCKTAFEIDQTWLIKAAAVRQKYIDQSQSVNLFKKAGVKGNVISDWYFLAWELGLKSTYYLKQQISELSYEEVISQDAPAAMCSIDNPECESCQ